MLFISPFTFSKVNKIFKNLYICLDLNINILQILVKHKEKLDINCVFEYKQHTYAEYSNPFSAHAAHSAFRHHFQMLWR